MRVYALALASLTLTLFALSPLMLVANWIEDRTRGRRSLRRQVRRFGTDLATATDQLTGRHAAEIRLRRAGVVDPAEALVRARTPSARLWERRLHPGDRDWVLAKGTDETQGTWSADYRTLARDGRTVWIRPTDAEEDPGAR